VLCRVFTNRRTVHQVPAEAGKPSLQYTGPSIAAAVHAHSRLGQPPAAPRPSFAMAANAPLGEANRRSPTGDQRHPCFGVVRRCAGLPSGASICSAFFSPWSGVTRPEAAGLAQPRPVTPSQASDRRGLPRLHHGREITPPCGRPFRPRLAHVEPGLTRYPPVSRCRHITGRRPPSGAHAARPSKVVMATSAPRAEFTSDQAARPPRCGARLPPSKKVRVTWRVLSFRGPRQLHNAPLDATPAPSPRRAGPPACDW